MWWTHLLPRIAEAVGLCVLGVAVSNRLALLAWWAGCVALVVRFPQKPYASVAVLLLQYWSQRSMLSVLTVVEVLLLTGRVSRWPFRFPAASEPALRVVDEQRGVVYEQITSATLAEVGHFWSRHAAHREPCARHLFQPFIRADPAAATRIETELDAGFVHFFAIQAHQRLGWFARSLATNQVVGYRFAYDYASVVWSFEDIVLHWGVSDFVFRGGVLSSWLIRVLHGIGFLPRAYVDFLNLVALYWYTDDRLVDYWRRVDPKFDVSRPGYLMSFSGVGVADEYLGRGIAGELVRVTLAHAKSRGFKKAQVWCTNSVSGHVFRDKLGWTLIEQESFDKFVVRGEAPFHGMTDAWGKPQPEYFLLVKDI